MECIWTATSEISDISPTSSIRMIDAGEYTGWLDGENWNCYRVVSREGVGEITQTEPRVSVREQLQEMPQDWVPFQILWEEELPVLEIRRGAQGQLERLRIPGWALEFRRAQQQPASRWRHRTLRSRQQVSRSRCANRDRSRCEPHRFGCPPNSLFSGRRRRERYCPRQTSRW